MRFTSSSLSSTPPPPPPPLLPQYHLFIFLSHHQPLLSSPFHGLRPNLTIHDPIMTNIIFFLLQSSFFIFFIFFKFEEKLKLP